MIQPLTANGFPYYDFTIGFCMEKLKNFLSVHKKCVLVLLLNFIAQLGNYFSKLGNEIGTH